ncbi:MAG: hypothetical protein HKN45_08810, partial [Flavobacteriales bacterium]|nr:hypothetical protein [Flavobacteriales bacterium]
MCRKNLMSMSLVALFPLLFIDGYGQTTITLGEQDFPGDQFSIEGPYSFNQRSQRTQTLITAIELQDNGLTQGDITEIGFQVADLVPNGALEDFTIRMGPSTGDFDFEFEPNLSEYFSTSSYTPNGGWNIHILDVPYQWDGFSDIILET